jgi:hypothetical protein
MFIAATTSASTIAAISERPLAGGTTLGLKNVPDEAWARGNKAREA